MKLTPFLAALACLGVFVVAFVVLLALELPVLECSFGGTAATVLFVYLLPAGLGQGPSVPPPADHGYAPNGGSADVGMAGNASVRWPIPLLAGPVERHEPSAPSAGTDGCGAPLGRGKDNHEHRSDDDRGS